MVETEKQLFDIQVWYDFFVDGCMKYNLVDTKLFEGFQTIYKSDFDKCKKECLEGDQVFIKNRYINPFRLNNIKTGLDLVGKLNSIISVHEEK